MQPSQPPAGLQGPAIPGPRLPQGPGALSNSSALAPGSPCAPPGDPVPSLVPRGRCFRPACEVSEWRRGGGPGGVDTPHHASPARATTQAAPASGEAVGQAGAQQRRPRRRPPGPIAPARHLLGPGGPTPHVRGVWAGGGHGLGSRLPEGEFTSSRDGGGCPPTSRWGARTCQECVRGRGAGRGRALERDLLGTPHKGTPRHRCTPSGRAPCGPEPPQV